MSEPYRYALWPPSATWRDGYLLGASLTEFKRVFPDKVKELGPPLRVWDSDPHRLDGADEGAAPRATS